MYTYLRVHWGCKSGQRQPVESVNVKTDLQNNNNSAVKYFRHDLCTPKKSKEDL